MTDLSGPAVVARLFCVGFRQPFPRASATAVSGGAGGI